VGLNHHTGEPIDPQMEGIFDNYSVKRQIINSGYASQLFICLVSCTRIEKKTQLMCEVMFLCSPIIASQLLLVDEVIRAGRNMRKPT
jgi:T-complex protein 1 subunit zeta